MKSIAKRQILLHHAVSIIGGFTGAYTIFNHSDIFVNAQTGNLLNMVINMTRGDFSLVPFMIIGFLVYCAGNVFYAIVRRHTKISMKIISLIVTSAAVVLVGATPFIKNDFAACYPLIFAMPVQWNAYKISGGNSSATTFSSNNVRQATMLLTKYFMDKDKDALKRSRFYWATLLSFHIGAAFATAVSLAVGVHAVWFCFIPIALAAVAYYRYKSEKLRVAALVNNSNAAAERCTTSAF